MRSTGQARLFAQGLQHERRRRIRPFVAVREGCLPSLGTPRFYISSSRLRFLLLNYCAIRPGNAGRHQNCVSFLQERCPQHTLVDRFSLLCCLSLLPRSKHPVSITRHNAQQPLPLLLYARFPVFTATDVDRSELQSGTRDFSPRKESRGHRALSRLMIK